VLGELTMNAVHSAPTAMAAIAVRFKRSFIPIALPCYSIVPVTICDAPSHRPKQRKIP
jgi:hypothetical protein